MATPATSGSGNPDDEASQRLAEFMSITGADEQVARRTVQDAGNNLQIAVNQYFSAQESPNAVTEDIGAPLLEVPANGPATASAPASAGPRRTSSLGRGSPGGAGPLRAIRALGVSHVGQIASGDRFDSLLGRWSQRILGVLREVLGGMFLFLRRLWVNTSPADQFRQRFLLSGGGHQELGEDFKRTFAETLEIPEGEDPIQYIDGSITRAVNLAFNKERPLAIILIDAPSVRQSGDVFELAKQTIGLRDTLQALHGKTAVFGFDTNLCLTHRLWVRSLHYPPNTLAGFAILVPVRLSPSLAMRCRRLLQQTPGREALPRHTIHGGAYGSHWPVMEDRPAFSDAETERILEEMQTRFLTISSDTEQMPSIGKFALEILDGGTILCYCLNLAEVIEATADDVNKSIRMAINAAGKLCEPFKLKLGERRLRQQQDRELVEQQRLAYEESLRLDRERAEREREEQQQREQQEHRQREEEEARQREAETYQQRIQARADVLLNRQLLDGLEDHEFAELLLRVPPMNERLRLQVYRHVRVQTMEECIACMDIMVKSPHQILRIAPAADYNPADRSLLDLGMVACRVEGTAASGATRQSQIPKDFQVKLTVAAGMDFSVEKSIEQAHLMPNGVLQLQPL